MTNVKFKFFFSKLLFPDTATLFSGPAITSIWRTCLPHMYVLAYWFKSERERKCHSRNKYEESINA